MIQTDKKFSVERHPDPRLSRRIWVLSVALAAIIGLSYCENSETAGLPCLGAAQNNEKTPLERIFGGGSDGDGGLLLECALLSESLSSSDSSGSSAPTYSIGGSISGLNNGSNVVLLNNSGDETTITGDGSTLTFAMNTSVVDGSSFVVTIQSTTDGDGCSITGGSGSGTVAGADVTSITISCSS